MLQFWMGISCTLLLCSRHCLIWPMFTSTFDSLSWMIYMNVNTSLHMSLHKQVILVPSSEGIILPKNRPRNDYIRTYLCCHHHACGDIAYRVALNGFLVRSNKTSLWYFHKSPLVASNSCCWSNLLSCVKIACIDSHIVSKPQKPCILCLSLGLHYYVCKHSTWASITASFIVLFYVQGPGFY